MTPIPHEPAILAVFILTYAGISAGRIPGLQLDRTGIALLGAIAVALVSRLPTTTVIGFVHWPTILLLFGFFVLAAQLRLSGFFDFVAGRIARYAGEPARFLLFLMLAAAGLSAVLNNDVVCIVFAPIVAGALSQHRRNPVPFLIALAIASNIGAAATFLGNAQNLMISQVADLRLGSYMAWCLPPVILALAAAYGIICLLCRRGWKADQSASTKPAPRGRVAPPPGELHPFNRAHVIKGLVILAIVCALFFTSLPKEIIALSAAGVHLASHKFKTRDLLNLVDWPVLVLFMGLFVVTGAFQATGAGDQLMGWLVGHGMNLGRPITLICSTAILSNLTNNAAAVMLLLKIAPIKTAAAAYTLALANSFGGSFLIVGSVANILTVQQARDAGFDISVSAFCRLGVPASLAALVLLSAWAVLMGGTH